VLVAVTYTGDRSIFSANSMREQGGYPARDSFQGPGPDEDEGETKLVLLPSNALGWWERNGNFEIGYDPESVGAYLLEANFIPEMITGPGYDPIVRETVVSQLGIEPFRNEEDLREQLHDVVGTDEEPDVQGRVEAAEESRSEKLMSEYDRSVLIKTANSYDDIDGLLEENDVSSVSHLGQTALAGFLAGREDDEVDRRLSTAEQGGEL